MVRDVSGNPVAGVSVTFALASGGGGVLPFTPVVTNASGVAALTSWTMGTVAGPNSITATSGTLAGSPLTFTATGTAGVATQLQMVTQPSSAAQSGIAFAVQPAVRLADAFGNLVATNAVTVTATIASGTGTLAGTATASTAAGVATFTNLAINGTAGAYTLGFSSTGLTGVTTTGVTLSAGTATKLAIVVQPSASAQNAIAFPQQPQVQVQDAAGNPVAGVASVGVTILTGGGTLGGTTPISTNAAGLATFAGLSITGTVGARTLQFTSAGLTSVTSAAIGLTAGVPTQMAVNLGQAQTATAGSAVAVDPSVVVRDVSNNPVDGVSVTFAVASGGGSVLPGTPVATDAVRHRDGHLVDPRYDGRGEFADGHRCARRHCRQPGHLYGDWYGGGRRQAGDVHPAPGHVFERWDACPMRRWSSCRMRLATRCRHPESALRPRSLPGRVES